MPETLKTLDLSDIKKTTALIYSVGRTMLSAGAFCAFEACATLGMRPFPNTSAYWCSALSMGMVSALDVGAKYVITADGDTIYGWEHIAYLWTMMETHPEADAIAALQCKRDSTALLMNVRAKPTVPDEVPGSADVLNEDLVLASVAHFGLTIFRREALLSVPQPWFLRLPNPEKPATSTDEDIYFWRQWAKHGRTLMVATRCPVGHVDEFVMWPGENFRTVLQSWAEHYEMKERPSVARKTSWELAEQQKAAEPQAVVA